MPGYAHVVTAQGCAELFRRYFTGWIYTDDADGPVAAITKANPILDADMNTPHAQVRDGLRRNEMSMSIVKLDDGTVSGPAVSFFTILFNGGNGIFKGSVGDEMLVPVSVMMRDVTSEGTAMECEVSSYAAKTTEYMVVQSDLMSRLTVRVKGYTRYTSTIETSRSMLSAACRSPAHVRTFCDIAQSPNAVERLVTSYPTAVAALVSGFKSVAVWHQLFGDSGAAFKDPVARSLATVAISRAVDDILDCA